MRQNLGFATKKLKKSTQDDSKIYVMNETKKTMKKIKLQKRKLELHLQQFGSFLEELMRTDNDSNETDLEK